MSENTAIRALQFNEVYDDTLDLIFIDEEHRDFFLLTLGRMKNVDERHLAFAYCLGISEKARERADQIYDFEGDRIRSDSSLIWESTGACGKAIRMAIHLYYDGISEITIEGNPDERKRNDRLCTVAELFCCVYAKFFWEAVKLRYPGFCR